MTPEYPRGDMHSVATAYFPAPAGRSGQWFVTGGSRRAVPKRTNCSCCREQRTVYAAACIVQEIHGNASSRKFAVARRRGLARRSSLKLVGLRGAPLAGLLIELAIGLRHRDGARSSH